MYFVGKLTSQLQNGIISAMLERIRSFLSSEIASKPKNWEEEVARSYRILNFQLQKAKEAQDSNPESFLSLEHAQRVRTRIGNFKETVINVAREEGFIFVYPEYIPIILGDRSYCYLPPNNKLIETGDRVVGVNFGGFISIPDIDSGVDVDEATWCLDKNLVNFISKQLLAMLPMASSRRILDPKIKY